MMCISSPAGRRLAVAKAALDKFNGVPIAEHEDGGRGFFAALNDYCVAAADVADELIAQRFHEMEGG